MNVTIPNTTVARSCAVSDFGNITYKDVYTILEIAF